jgi:hypothetical protein
LITASAGEHIAKFCFDNCIDLSVEPIAKYSLGTPNFKRIVQISYPEVNALQEVTKAVVEAARESLVIGEA